MISLKNNLKLTNMEKIIELFDKYENEYLKFDKIPFDDRPFESPDLCAFKIIHSLLKKEHKHKDIIRGAEHDEIFLTPLDNIDTETPLFNMKIEKTVEYLVRCGVRYSEEYNSLCMFV